MATASKACSMANKSRSSCQEGPASSGNEDPGAGPFLAAPQVHGLLTQDVDGVQAMLAEVLDLRQPQTELHEAVLLDYYVSGFWWAKEMGFTDDQLAGFMGLLNTLMVNLEAKTMTLEDNIRALGRAMAGIGPARAANEGALTVDQAKAVITYLKNSLFQHYKLYEFMASCSRDELVVGAEQAIDVPQPVDVPFPAPLEEGIPCDLYVRFIAPQPPLPMEEAEEAIGETEASTDDVDPIAGFTLEDVKSVLGEVTKTVIGSLQTEINEKLRMQEESYTARIDQLRKA